ncbi:MAG: hypothetical protein J6R92_07520 [Akkermansia sp.]|nr:hypothetical protein [Akkermansia sp.]
MKISYLPALLLMTPALHAAPEAALPGVVKEAFDAYSHLPGVLVPIMQKAQDTKSANACATELKQALIHVYNVREKLHNLPRLTPSQNQQVRQQYEQIMRKEWGRMYDEISRLQGNRCFQSADFAEVFRLLCMMIEK